MKTDKKPLRERIYSQLIEDIVAGRINAGEKLLEEELTERFNVSRTPVREALFMLEKEGFILHKKNIGAVVKKITEGNVKEIFEVVAQLEGYATERICFGNNIEKKVNELSYLQEKMEYFSNLKNYYEYQNVNIEFHRFFIENCDNQTLKETVIALRTKIYKLVKEGLSLPMYIDKYLLSHRKIIEMVSSKQSLNAGLLMREHVLESGKYLLEEIKLRNDSVIEFRE